MLSEVCRFVIYVAQKQRKGTGIKELLNIYIDARRIYDNVPVLCEVVSFGKINRELKNKYDANTKYD